MATRQHGVVSARQLDGLGYSPSSAAKATKAGRLRRIHRGVYAVGHESLSGTAAVAGRRSPQARSSSHLSWMAVGLLRNRLGAIHVTAPALLEQRQQQLNG